MYPCGRAQGGPREGPGRAQGSFEIISTGAQGQGRFPLLILKGIDHNWKNDIFRGPKRKWRKARYSCLGAAFVFSFSGR